MNFFYVSLNNSSFSQIFWSFPCILSKFNCTVVWIVLILLYIFILSTFFSKFLEIFPSVQTLMTITVTFVFHSCFNFLLRSSHSSKFSPSFIFALGSVGKVKSTLERVIFSCLSKLGLMLQISLGDPFLSQSSIEYFTFYFQKQILVYAYIMC